jgi:hypothetical protein
MCSMNVITNAAIVTDQRAICARYRAQAFPHFSLPRRWVLMMDYQFMVSSLGTFEYIHGIFNHLITKVLFHGPPTYPISPFKNGCMSSEQWEKGGLFTFELRLCYSVIAFCLSTSSEIDTLSSPSIPLDYGDISLPVLEFSIIRIRKWWWPQAASCKELTWVIQVGHSEF